MCASGVVCFSTCTKRVLNKGITMEDPGKIFQKVMIVPDNGEWMVALCRVGFLSQSDAMAWTLQYMNPTQPSTVIDDLYREAIEDALRSEE